MHLTVPYSSAAGRTVPLHSPKPSLTPSLLHLPRIITVSPDRNVSDINITQTACLPSSIKVRVLPDGKVQGFRPPCVLSMMLPKVSCRACEREIGLCSSWTDRRCPRACSGRNQVAHSNRAARQCLMDEQLWHAPIEVCRVYTASDDFALARWKQTLSANENISRKVQPYLRSLPRQTG